MHTHRHPVEYDHAKSIRNFRKHGVHFVDAEQAVLDPHGRTTEDTDAQGEIRFITLGCDGKGRLLVVIRTVREGVDRIISARKASAGERAGYG